MTKLLYQGPLQASRKYAFGYASDDSTNRIPSLPDFLNMGDHLFSNFRIRTANHVALDCRHRDRKRVD